jgi:transcriptional regulator
MYIPRAFAEENRETLYTFIQQHPFGLLISQRAGILTATHIPFILDRQQGEYGTLLGHLARANPQWQGLDASELLVVFQGPHTYISPSWYQSTLSVPTWNYTAVHTYGTPRILDDQQELFALIQTQIKTYEATLTISDDYTQKLLGNIVGFTIPITRLEGKFKLSQNRSRQDQENVVQHLNESNNPLAAETAGLMTKRLEHGQ